VLLHGLGGSWRWWRSLVPALAEHHCVHVVDIPRLGPGLRARDASSWLAGLLDALELRRPDVVGHSLGGLFAAQLAAGSPDRVRRLALIAPAGIPAGRHVVANALPLAAALRATGRSLPTVVADSLRTGPIALLEGGRFAASTDLRTELGSIVAPTLVIWGERDRLVPARLARDWVEALPDARLVHLSAGHVPMFDAPRALADTLVDFFRD
jgi:pimeloyl-ACP methyl ester carboxylesterase